jgi:hypothetical protein
MLHSLADLVTDRLRRMRQPVFCGYHQNVTKVALLALGALHDLSSHQANSAASNHAMWILLQRSNFIPLML